MCVWPLTSGPNEGRWDCCSFWSLQCDLLPEYTEDYWKCQDVPKVIAVEGRTKPYLQEVYSSNIVRSRVGCFRRVKMVVSKLENWEKRKKFLNEICHSRLKKWSWSWILKVKVINSQKLMFCKNWFTRQTLTKLNFFIY